MSFNGEMGTGTPTYLRRAGLTVTPVSCYFMTSDNFVGLFRVSTGGKTSVDLVIEASAGAHMSSYNYAVYWTPDLGAAAAALAGPSFSEPKPPALCMTK